jgi:serine O-acetyltransferase
MMCRLMSDGSLPPPAEISANVPDWSREAFTVGEWSPSRRLLAAIRAYQRWRDVSGALGVLGRGRAILEHRFWSIACACDIPLNCQLGGGLLLPHPLGVVIHPQATIGPNCLIFQQVTIGTVGDRPGAPVIGGHVDIGAGAKILGGVTIGAHARIGANAVVLNDVPVGGTAVGIPARLLPTR